MNFLLSLLNPRTVKRIDDTTYEYRGFRDTTEVIDDMAKKFASWKSIAVHYAHGVMTAKVKLAEPTTDS